MGGVLYGFWACLCFLMEYFVGGFFFFFFSRVWVEKKHILSFPCLCEWLVEEVMNMLSGRSGLLMAMARGLSQAPLSGSSLAGVCPSGNGLLFSRGFRSTSLKG